MNNRLNQLKKYETGSETANYSCRNTCFISIKVEFKVGIPLFAVLFLCFLSGAVGADLFSC